MFKSLIADKRNISGITRGGHSARDIENSLGYACYQGKSAKNPQVCFLIGNNLMKEARFIDGDYVDVQYDEELQLGLIKRLPQGNARNGNKLSHKGKGKTSRLFVSGIAGPFPKSKVMNLENVTVDNEGILFSWPKSEIKGGGNE